MADLFCGATCISNCYRAGNRSDSSGSHYGSEYGDGMITPPVELNLFVTAGVSTMNVVKATLPWVGIMFVFLILVTYSA